jgi:hypothetical protein
MVKYPLFLILIFVLISCKDVNKQTSIQTGAIDFNAESLNPELVSVKMVTGQLLYLPVYSNIPYQIDTIKFDMSAFIAIHNTDLDRSIRLTKVLYFNQDGKLVKDYLKDEVLLAPLATRDFYVPYEDQSGTGANFLIEWTSDTLVNEPLIESITTCLKPNNTIAVLSQGKVIRERK